MICGKIQQCIFVINSIDKMTRGGAVKKFNWSDENRLREIVSQSLSQSQVLREIGLTPASNMVTLRRYLKKYNIDTSHFDPLLSRPQTRNGSTRLPIEKIMVAGSSFDRGALRRRIISEKVLPYICDKCGNDGTWQNESLSLHLDHINGDNADHRRENLRFLCPNCHTQTRTYAGRNKGNSAG